ncbi:FHA domain-containing protein [Deinococcus cavernae]|uniref:FHA domain-containing protein n=1 Tax=Deinococcus cavernae TaxID=2320857 RepID=A0A418V596_9DEIO|nr:FHA domain-containing protein [Deinococcus cavernae]RJF71281.1 FHA domain-containing protein [Deinococcus cavernae]
MTINCQVCGTANPDTNKYCDGCGVELTHNTPTTETASMNGAAAPVAEMATMSSPPVSEADPIDPATSVPTPDGMMSDTASAAAAPVTPLTPPETIGSGTTPNPYRTPLSETSIGQLDSSAPATTASAASPELTAPELTGPVATSTPDVSNADASLPSETAAPVSTPAVEVPPLENTTAPASTESPVMAAPISSPTTTTTTGTGGAAKLGLKKFGQPTGDFIPLNGEKLVVGRFDASSGPVDIDLGDMAGKEHISRHHAELYNQNGVWHVRDLGSTNGVFLKKKGESTFSPRLQEPAALADGDELAFGNVMLTFNQG